MTDPSTPLVADRVLRNRYRLIRPIARGGMAEVWEAKDEVLARYVAVKVLHAHLACDGDFVERFRREAIAAAKLGHPNVVATYDAATDDDEAFIVMELVRGRSVREALSEDGPFPPERAVVIATQVASALGHAHANGLVHRDVKPGNVLLCEDGRDIQAKVADFGIAKAAAAPGGDLTQAGAIVGTAKYLSPEQVEGREPDARSDVYSLGVTLYEMVCGRPPFAADTDMATALARLRDAPIPPRRVRPGIPKSLDAAILHALTRDPKDRPQTALAFRAELAAIDIAPDDATPIPAVDDTPADGFALGRGRDDQRAVSHRFVPLLLLLAVVVAVGVLAGLLMSAGGTGRSHQPKAPAAGGAPVAIVRALAFDPESADHDEHNDAAPRAADGNPSTFWETSHYSGPHFGGLKDGVGLVLETRSAGPVHQLRVTTATQGWSAQVYVAPSPGRTLADWGTPVTAKSDIIGTTTFDLGSVSGAAVLLWITDPGAGNHAVINEVSLS